MVKVIHYCWFGHSPLDEKAKKCIESWKRYCPDYQIIQWNEDNYDVNKCIYIREAYEKKKWAFVSDYARFDVLYQHGGIYFDTDVELIRPIDDIVVAGPFMGFEKNTFAGDEKSCYAVNPGLGIGADKNMSLVKTVLDAYSERHFIREDGTIEQYTIVQFVTDILIKNGLKSNNRKQIVQDFSIYPADYFCPLNYETGILNITKNTRSIHHYSATWQNKSEKIIHRIGQQIGRVLGAKCGYYMEMIIGTPYQIIQKIRQIGFIETIKFITKRICRWN